MARRKKKKISKKNIKKILLLIALVFSITIYLKEGNVFENKSNNIYTNVTSILEIPEYTGEICITINNNIPNFDQEDYTKESFEKYSKLDKFGRCGVAYANICSETMPDKDEERESISSVYPTGWEQKKYDGEYLYNRCHLIGYQLSAENAKELNLITGTRYFNVEGMLPFENEVAEYLEENENNHVLYRVTPVFKENNLLASGVQIEAYSIEDKGKGICFNVYVYNIQPEVDIDYATGRSFKN